MAVDTLRPPVEDLPPTDDGEELLPCVEMGPATDAQAAVIWLHGLGANGYDFAPVPPELGLPKEMAIRYLFPHAPEIPVTLNMGLVMPAWYDIASLDSRGHDETRIRRNAGRIQDLIARERDRGVPPDRILLAGFSQGAALALFTALRFPDRLAGLIVLSSYLLLPDLMAQEAVEANRNLPVFQAHGLHDPLVPVAMGRTCRDELQEQGHPVEWHEYPMEHEVCLEEIRDIGKWIEEHLNSEF